jgi:hypothetical protein
MGEFQFGNQDKIQFSAPTRVQELADVMIADVVVRVANLVCLLCLNSSS